MSKEHSYRFNRDMTRAVLDGRKWMTRRPIKEFNEPVPMSYVCQITGDNTFIGWCSKSLKSQKQAQLATDLRYDPGEGVKCPYGKPGDTFRLSEAVQVRAVDHERYSLMFDADLMHCERYGDPELMERIRGYKRGHLRGCTLPPAFCRSQRWEITEVRAERICDITNADCIAEGIEPIGEEKQIGDCLGKPVFTQAGRFNNRYSTVRQLFSEIWADCYGHDSWSRNDWVWVIAWRAVSDA